MREMKTFCMICLQAISAVYFLGIQPCFAQSYVLEFKGDRSPASRFPASRFPANFVPDDDLIVVPLVVEKNFYQRFNEKHKNSFKGARQRLEFWITQEQYAEDYGLENTGFVRLPTPAQKEQFLQRNYLRFISKDVERSNNDESRSHSNQKGKG